MNYLRFLAAFFILSVCFSCKTKEVVKPNSPPSSFTVTATLADNGKDIILKWTKSKDPDGDAVTYAVVYKDTLAKNLSDTTYIIKNLPYETEIKGSIVAKDLKGGIVNSLFSTKTNEDPYVKIPDINFEKALIELKIDDVQDGKLLKSSAEKVTKLELIRQTPNDTISSLIGLESFNRLQYLSCSGHRVRNLNLDNNLNLDTLICDINQLTSLDISQCTNLKHLSCESNQLTNLDVSKNINLKILDCSVNRLTSIDVGKNIFLKELFCVKNQLKSLILPKSINLEIARCDINQLTSLDVSQCTNLRGLSCESNQLKSLDVSQCTNLENLICRSNQLSNLDVSKNINLNLLWCNSNKIQTICVNSLNQVKPDWQKDASATYKVCN